MSKDKALFADTTVVYYVRHSHPLLRAEVRRLAAGRPIALSNFVRGEYIRGYVVGLIELYFVIKEEKSVRNGMHVFTSQMGGRPRRLATALQSTMEWLCGHTDWQETETTLRRLGNYIRSCVYLFDDTFQARHQDPLLCEYGFLHFPKETYDEGQILDFYEQFKDIEDEPHCDQCVFRQNQVRSLEASKIDLYSEAQRAKYKKAKEYVKQATAMGQAARSPKTGPSCWHCQRLGDSIIALSSPAGAVIFSGDAQSFPVLAELLGKELLLVPSLDRLRKERDSK